jgi:molecular chaperone Hsp33
MTDVLLRCMSKDGLHRVFAARTTDAVAEAVTRHELIGAPAMALARGLTAALLAAATDPEWHRMSFQWASRGPLGTMHVDVRRPGNVRGYVNLAENALEAVGRPVEAWVRPGILVALRQEPSARFSQGQIPIGTGAVDHDVENYLERSEGVASGLRVLASKDALGSPVDVTGVLVQTLPGGDSKRTILPVEISDRVRPPGPLEDLMAAALPGMGVDILERVPVRFHCPCSRNRVEMSIRLLGASELEEMIIAEEGTSVRCEFCATDYDIGVKDLERILEGLKEHPIGEA